MSETTPVPFSALQEKFTDFPASGFHAKSYSGDELERFRGSNIDALTNTPLNPAKGYYDHHYRQRRISQWQSLTEAELNERFAYFLYVQRFNKLEPVIAPVRRKIWAKVPPWQAVLFGQIASFAIPPVVAAAKNRQPDRYEKDHIDANFASVFNAIGITTQADHYPSGSYTREYGDDAEIQFEHDAANLGLALSGAHHERISRIEPNKVKPRIPDIAIGYQIYEIMRAAEFLYNNVYGSTTLNGHELRIHYLFFREIIRSGQYSFPNKREEMERVAQQVDTSVHDFWNNTHRFDQALTVVARYHRFWGTSDTDLLMKFLRPNTREVFAAAIA